MTLEERIWKEKGKKKQSKILTSKLSLKNSPCIFFPSCTNSRIFFSNYGCFLFFSFWKWSERWVLFVFFPGAHFVSQREGMIRTLEKKIFCDFFLNINNMPRTSASICGFLIFNTSCSLFLFLCFAICESRIPYQLFLFFLLSIILKARLLKS